MENTKIPWCDHTFNPWVGCEAVSEGCANCYARTMHERWHGKGSFKIRTATGAKNWEMPERWSLEAEKTGRRARVFCGSMCDWLDLRVPAKLRCDLLHTMLDERLQIDWLVLTKRPECWSTALLLAWRYARASKTIFTEQLIRNWIDGYAPKHVWFGVTAENQARWDERCDAMRAIPAAVRWVSAEPLIGPVVPRPQDMCGAGGVDWVVAGGENGGGARECHAEWIANLWLAGSVYSKPFFFKQWGKNAVRYPQYADLESSIEKRQEWPKA